MATAPNPRVPDARDRGKPRRGDPRKSFRVTAKLSRKFYEKLGDDVANELVEWFNDRRECFSVRWTLPTGQT